MNFSNMTSKTHLRKESLTAHKIQRAMIAEKSYKLKDGLSGNDYAMEIEHGAIEVSKPGMSR